MKVFQFPLTKITLCFIAGIIISHFAGFEPSLALIFTGIGFLAFGAVFYYSRKQAVPTTFGIAVALLSVCIGIATQSVHKAYFDPNHYIHLIPFEEKPHTLEVVLREKLKPSVSNDRYIALVQRIDGVRTSGRLLVNLDKGEFGNAFPIGTQLQLTGTVLKHRKPRNPDQFDYGNYLMNKSILAQLYAHADQVKINPIPVKDAFYYSDALRSHILNNLAKNHFAATELQVIAALILGQQQDISSEIVHDYQFAGAIHILSVSGLHVGFIVLFLNFLLQYLPRNKKTSYLKLSIVLLSLWGFALLAGLSPSVIRSVTMFSFVAVGMHLKRKTNVFHTLLVSLFLILLFEPSFLFDVGFQLSYAALFFILWLQPLLNRIWVPQNKVVQYFWQILTVSFAAQIGTLPLSIYYFHQFPGLFFVTNLAVIPFLSIIMTLGVIVMVLAAFDYVPEILSESLEWSVRILNAVINRIASLEHFIFQDIPFSFYMLLSLYILVVTIIYCFEKLDFKKIAFALIALFLFQGSYFGTRWISRHENEWIVFNSRKSTLIAERNGENVSVYSDVSITGNTLLQSYLTANFCHIEKQKPVCNTAYFNSKKIMLIDSLGVYPAHAAPDIIVMRESPKINLDRLLLHCKPEMIVADATNFKSYVRIWEATCRKAKIPFHTTVEKGFYRLQ